MLRKIGKDVWGAKKNAGYYITVADQCRDAQAWDEAAENYRSALEIKADRADIWVQLGHALKEGGNLSEAEKAYSKALELKPEVADSNLQMGHVLKITGKIAEAAGFYLKAHSLDLRSPHARRELIGMGWTEQDIQRGIEFTTEAEAQTEAEDAEAFGEEDDYLRKASFNESDYLAENPDVARLCDQALILSGEQYHRLYGYSEGRDIVRSLKQCSPTRVFVLCPSFGKRCGIGEHARYIVIALERAGFDVTSIRSSEELDYFDSAQLKDAVLIVNHGPGLFDGYNPELSEGEATTDLAIRLRRAFELWNVRPVILMHSMLDRDNEVMYGKQEFLLDFPIPVITTIESASKYFRIPQVEHGVQPVDAPKQIESSRSKRDYPTIGFFGFFQWGGKDFDALINVARVLKAKLVGSVATGAEADVDRLKEILTAAGVNCDLGTGWVTDAELAQRLAEADFYYLPQKDYDHWNNSGTARFVTNFGKPLLLPPYQPFLDLRDVALFAEEHELPKVIAALRDDRRYKEACERVKNYQRVNGMEKTMDRIARHLPVVIEEFTASSFADSSPLSLQELSCIPEAAARSRLMERARQFSRVNCDPRVDTFTRIYREAPELIPLKFLAPQAIELWRRHYQLAQLWFLCREDLIHGVYRTLAKREPSFFEYRIAMSKLPGMDKIANPDKGSVKLILKFIGTLLKYPNTSGIKSSIEIVLGKSALSIQELINAPDDLVVNVLNQVAIPASAVLAIDDKSQQKFCCFSEKNLFQVLCFPASQMAESLSVASGGVIPISELEPACSLRSIRMRYVRVAHLFANYGVNLFDRFLIDEPTVMPIDVSRRQYCAREFFLLDGDSFITNLVRCLAKRNPYAREMFSVGYTLNAKGKLAALREYSAKENLNGKVVDWSNTEIEFAADSKEAKDFRRLVEDFRSVYAGGWDLRNIHLEAQRDFSRFWLRSKRVRDIWWMQSGGDINALSVR